MAAPFGFKPQKIEEIAKKLAMIEFPDVAIEWDDPNSIVAQHKEEYLMLAEKVFHTFVPDCPVPPEFRVPKN